MAEPRAWTLKAEVILVAVVMHAGIGRHVPITFDDPRDVAWWIGQLFDGPRHVVQRVYWLTAMPASLVDVTSEFAMCVARYVGDRDPDCSPWPDDMVAFCERHPSAEAFLDGSRAAWANWSSPKYRRETADV